MRIESFGGRQIAFGLKWVAGEGNTEAVLSTAFGLDGDRPPYIYLSPSSKKGEDGTVGVAGSQSKLAGRVFSASDAIASVGRDGLYVMQFAADDAVWFSAVKHGAIVEGTDVVLQLSEAVSQVAALAPQLELPVIVDSALADLPIAQAFGSPESLDIAAILGTAEIKPLIPTGSKAMVWVALALVAVVAIGFVAIHSQKSAAPGPDPQVVRQQQIEAYVAQASSAIGKLPEDNGWALAAFARARASLPPFIAGWELDKVDCLPSACHAQYKHSGDGAYALSPVDALFGEHNVNMTTLGRVLEVTLPLKATTVNVSEGWLRSVEPASEPFGDWLGRVPYAMGGGRVAGSAVAMNLDKQNRGHSLGLPSLTVDQVAVSAADYLDAATLAGIVQQGGVDGFRIVRLTWAPSIDKPTWQIAWERVHG